MKQAWSSPFCCFVLFSDLGRPPLGRRRNTRKRLPNEKNNECSRDGNEWACTDTRFLSTDEGKTGGAHLEHTRELGNQDENWGHGERAWEAALDDYFAEHNEIRLDGDARSAAYLSIDESPEAEQHLWHVRQIFLDENADGDFRIEADVNLDATQEEGEVIFKNYRVGFVEDLAESDRFSRPRNWYSSCLLWTPNFL